MRSVDLSEKETTVLNVKLIAKKKKVNILVTLRNFHCFSSSTGCTQRNCVNKKFSGLQQFYEPAKHSLLENSKR